MVHYYVYKNIIFTEPVFDTLTKYLAQRPISSTGPMGNMAIPSIISPFSQKGETPEFTHKTYIPLTQLISLSTFESTSLFRFKSCCRSL